MANTKISEMEEATSISENDILPIVKDGSNKKASIKTVFKTVQGFLVPDSIPIGMVVEFPSDNIPDNWLLCNGQAVSRTDYTELFAAIGTTWGAGDGSTTFNVPTKEGLVTVGKKASDSDFNTLGKTGGEKTHKLTEEELTEHQHAISCPNAEGPYTANIAQVASSEIKNTWAAIMTTTQSTGGDQPHNNLQPYITSNFIIKAKQSAGVVATVVDNLNSDSTTDALSAKQGKELNDKISEIIESGSNSNGKYIKFSDGTMICRGTIAITVNQSRISGGLTYYSNETYFDFPVAFIDTDIQITTNIQLANMNLFAQTYALAESKSQGRIALAITQNNESRNIDWVAIGKWK